MNIFIISYMHLNNNSGIHIANIAANLEKLGHVCTIFVPDSKEEVPSAEFSGLKVLNFSDLDHGHVGPDLIHAWTPREVVRKFTQKLVNKYACPYVVHMEDNEEYLTRRVYQWTAAQLEDIQKKNTPVVVPDGLSHPVRYKEFIGSASGYTSVIDELVEFKPVSVPGVVFWPSYNHVFEEIHGINYSARQKLGIRRDDWVIVYTGNVHHSNRMEVCSLYLAVLQLNKRGIPVKLVRTGQNHAALFLDGVNELKNNCIDLGMIPAVDLPETLAMADVLVQPGKVDQFNMYRFPSKIPEYLASGRPVILPEANIGLHLTDGIEALLLKKGGAAEIADKLQILFGDESMRRRLGENGRAFAKANFSWSFSAEEIAELYSRIRG